jgi:hypothetical protein
MKPKKGNPSTSKQGKQPAKKSTKKTTGTSKATRQNNRKRVAPNDSDADSNDEGPKRNKRNKKRHVEEVEEDESEITEPEEVVESDEDVQLVDECEAGGNVSELLGVIRSKNSLRKRTRRNLTRNQRTDTSLKFPSSYE